MKIALITGGNRGIGRSAALHVAQRGTGVLLTYRQHREEADAVVEEIRRAGGKAAALMLDVTKVGTFETFVGEVRRVLKEEFNQTKFDYLVNNAGFAQRTLIEKTNEQEFDDLVNVHFKGPFFLTQKLLPLLADGGQILNISSGLARFAAPGMATYGSLKAAIEMLTIYLAKELAPRKIRANVVAPGPIATEFGGGKNDPEVRKHLSAATALGRIGEAEDIGVLIAGLLSDDTRWVNAQRIEASGGINI